jgi:uncharacterized membrane protein YfhO
MFPFGENTLENIDLQIIYTYYYEWYKQVLTSGGSLFYSFSKSLGGNMFAGWTCLLSSPISLLVIFFSDSAISFITFSVALKFGLAGITSYAFLRRRFTLEPVLALALSICYALSLYMTTQCINPNWLEAVVMLPLVMYGIFTLVNRGKILCFAISLLLTIIFNFYIGFMVCLFCILYYLFECALCNMSGNSRLRYPLRFALTFFLVGMASAVILVPTVMALAAGKGGEMHFLSYNTFYDLPYLIRSLFLGVYEPDFNKTAINVLPQLYTGTFTLMAAIWFFVNKDISHREKLIAAIFVAILLLSTWSVMADRVWLGLRSGNDFYCRYAFLASALFIFLAGRALSLLNIKNTKNYVRVDAGIATNENANDVISPQTCKTVSAGTSVDVLREQIVSKARRQRKQIMLISAIVAATAIVIALDVRVTSHRITALAALFAMLLCFCLFFVLRTNKSQALSGKLVISNLFRIVASILLIVVVSAEALVSWHSVNIQRQSWGQSVSYSEQQQYFNEGHSFIQALRNLEADGTKAYRVGKDYNLLNRYFPISTNEAMAFGYYGVPHYDSSYDDKVQNVLAAFGYTPDRRYQSNYNGIAPVADSILGIKYVISQNDIPAYEPVALYETTDVVAVSDANDTADSNSAASLLAWDGGTAYKNPNALPFGFEASNNILQPLEVGDTRNPFAYQNAFLKSLSGIDADAYTMVSATLTEDLSDRLTWTIDTSSMLKGAPIYAYIYSEHEQQVNLYIDGDYRMGYLSDWSQGIFTVGSVLSYDKQTDGQAATQDGAQGGAQGDTQNGVQAGAQDGIQETKCLASMQHTISLVGDIGTSEPELDSSANRTKTKGLQLYVAVVNDDVLRAAAEKLRQHEMQINEIRDGYILANYKASNNCLLFTSIPYDKGWELFINGDKAEPIELQNAFLGIMVPEGSNVIELRYTPPGLILGFGVSVIAILLLLIYASVLAFLNNK